MVDDKLALEVISDFNEKNHPGALHSGGITAAVSQAAGREMTIELMSVKERVEWQERQRRKKRLPAMRGINIFHPGNRRSTRLWSARQIGLHAAAALAVAEQPGVAYNPLFHGGVGLGKTHPDARHRPFHSGTFRTCACLTRSSAKCLPSNERKTREFSQPFFNVDVLMLHDIQLRIAGRDSTQEEFFHTFNALHSAGRSRSSFLPISRRAKSPVWKSGSAPL